MFKYDAARHDEILDRLYNRRLRAVRRKYEVRRHPKPWASALINARATWLSFDYWWQRTLGDRIVEADEAAKEPPVNLLQVHRLEFDAFIAARDAMKQAGLDPSIKHAVTDGQFKLGLLEQARLANPSYVDVHNRVYHHMWHVWQLPPSSALSVISKYIAIGLISGGIFAGYWRYGYHLPLRKKIDAFYKTLYAEHPEFWPALAMQKKN